MFKLPDLSPSIPYMFTIDMEFILSIETLAQKITEVEHPTANDPPPDILKPFHQ